MGRHTVPGSGRPTPDRGFWVRAAVVLVVAGLALTYALTRGADDDTARTTAEPPASQGSPTSPSSAATSPASSSTAPSPSTSPSPSSPDATSEAPADRPPTLRFTVRRDSWITVRIPGGRTLVSRLFEAGEKRKFDQRRLEVVNGRPTAVRFFVNGKLRRPGSGDGPETFTVRRG